MIYVEANDPCRSGFAYLGSSRVGGTPMSFDVFATLSFSSFVYFMNRNDWIDPCGDCCGDED